MSNYYSKRDAKVNIAHQLMSKDWEVFGYSANQSDSMTDYYCPADWNGIATKNGFVLVVDNNSASYSGKAIQEYTFNNETKSNVNYASKIEKLSNMTVKNGCTEAEAENAQAQIEKLKANQNEQSSKNWTVTGYYPSYMANPKGSMWHVEKDGIIIAKGRSLTTMARVPEEWLFDFETETFKPGHDTYINGSKRVLDEDGEKAVKALKTFIKKLESTVAVKVGDGEEDQLVKIIENKEIISKELNEVTGRTNLKVGGVFKDNSRNNVQITDIDENGRLTTIKLGTKKGGYKQSKSMNSVSFWRAGNIQDLFTNGKIKIYEIVEVVEIIEVEKWVKKPTPTAKKAVKPSSDTNTQEQQTEAIAPDKSSENSDKVDDVKVVYNEEKNGIELYFDGKPSEEIREVLKANGFRWAKFNKAWYTKDTSKARDFIQSFTGSSSEDAETVTVASVNNDIQIVELENYTISPELSKRENDGNWIFRTKEVDHNSELQGLFNSILERVNIILPNLSELEQLKLKRNFNYFIKSYHANRVKELTLKANTPSWAVTGRSGRNMNKYNNAMDRLNTIQLDGMKLYNIMIEKLEKHERKIKKAS